MQANTHNIEISQESPGDLPMDCMHMTLLSPVRHHEVLQDYEAPSQGYIKSLLFRSIHCKVQWNLAFMFLEGPFKI